MEANLNERMALAAMQAKETLLEDYVSIKNSLYQAQAELAVARYEERNAAKKVKETQETYDMVERVIVKEQIENGKNAEERKLNAAMAIDREKTTTQDGQVGRLRICWRALCDVENELADKAMAREINADYLSTLRNVARMLSGMGHAFGA